MRGRDDLAIAYHEAGHAVAARCLGRAFKTVSIIGDDTTAGRVHLTPLGEWFRPDVEVDGRTRYRIEQDVQITLFATVKPGIP